MKGLLVGSIDIGFARIVSVMMYERERFQRGGRIGAVRIQFSAEYIELNC
jgi:hypothetical protein